MTQEYTPVAWQDETTSQQGTLINAERLNQMQTAHHYADGLEEVDAIPTADPGVSYHKIVYCTADSTIYRWDGTEWTKDIDDETKALLQQEIARATAAESELAQSIEDEATARETADSAMQADITALQSDKLDKKTAGLTQTQVYGVKHNTQKMLTLGQASGDIPMYSLDSVLYSKMPTLYDPINDTVINYGWATAQIGAEATARADADTALGGRIDTEQARAEAAEQANAQAIANTYTKAEIDTALGAKADVATTYTKTETDTLLGAKANDNAVVHLNGAETIPGVKTFTGVPTILTGSADANNLNLRNDNLTLADQTGGHNTAIAFRGASDALLARFRYRNGRIDNAPARNISLDIYDATGTAHTFELCRLINNTTESWPVLDGYLPMLRTTGNQTFSGIKKAGGSGYYRKQSATLDLATPPAGTITDENYVMEDKNGTTAVQMFNSYTANAQTIFQIATKYPFTEGGATKISNAMVWLTAYADKAVLFLRFVDKNGASHLKTLGTVTEND